MKKGLQLEDELLDPLDFDCYLDAVVDPVTSGIVEAEQDFKGSAGFGLFSENRFRNAEI